MLRDADGNFQLDSNGNVRLVGPDGNDLSAQQRQAIEEATKPRDSEGNISLERCATPIGTALTDPRETPPPSTSTGGSGSGGADGGA